MNAWATNRAADGKPGVWSFSIRSLSMVLGMWMEAQVVALLRRLLADDAHGVGRIVAADIQEPGRAVGLQRCEDVPAIGQIGLVIASSPGPRTAWRRSLRDWPGFRPERSTKSSFTMPRTPVARAIDPLDLRKQSRFEHGTGQRLIDHRRRAAAHGDHQLAASHSFGSLLAIRVNRFKPEFSRCHVAVGQGFAEGDEIADFGSPTCQLGTWLCPTDPSQLVVAAMETSPEQPEAPPLLISTPVIVADGVSLTGRPRLPPFLGDPLWPIGTCHAMPASPPDEAKWRVVRQEPECFDRLRRL